MDSESTGSSVATTAIRSSPPLYIGIALLLMALAIGFQLKSLELSRDQYEESTRLNAQNLGATLAASIAGSFQNIDLTLLNAVDLMRLQRRLKVIDAPTIDTGLVEMRDRVPSLVALRVTNASGDVIFGTELDNAEKLNVADRAYFQQAKANPSARMVISEPVLGRIIKKWSLICARRITLPNGEFDGIVYGLIELEGMPERLSGKEIKLGDRDSFILRDNDLNVITHYVHGKQNMAILGRKVTSPNYEELFGSGVNAGFYHSKSTIDDVERIFYFQRIARQPMNLVVGLSVEDALAGWSREAQNSWIETGTICLVIALGAFVIYRAQMRKHQAVSDLENALVFNQKIIDNSAIGIHVYRADGQCVLANPVTAEIIGATQSELHQQNFRELVSWKECGALDMADQALTTGTTQQLRAKVNTSFRKQIWLHWVFTPFVNHGQKQLLVMIRDITEIQQAREALEESNRKLIALSTTDALTGIANRRYFDDMLKKEWRRAARNRQPLSLAMIDVDRFKDYNFYYGHQGGDECLRRVARVLEQQIRRAGDLIARYGGEEFVYIGQATDSASARRLVENVRQDIELLALPHELSPFGNVTVSIGVATIVPEEWQTPDILVKKADEALYAAKEQGRNRVVLHGEI